jgi:hypothetical protein
MRQVDFDSLLLIAKKVGLHVSEIQKVSYTAYPFIAIENGRIRVGATPDSFEDSKAVSNVVMAALMTHPEAAITGFKEIVVKIDNTVVVF